MQKATSARTSINSVKLPKLFKLGLINKPTTILDYGCGKYTSHIADYCHAKLGSAYHGFDPFNQTPEQNDASLWKVLGEQNVTVTCSNVLNVIDDDETIIRILERMRKLGDRLIVTVYEGDKSGKGRYTQYDCYQRNMKLKQYIPFLQQAGWKNVKSTRGALTAEK